MFVYIRLSGLLCAALAAAGPVGRRDDDTRPAVYHFDNIPVETGNFLPTNPAQLNYIDGLYFRGLHAFSPTSSATLSQGEHGIVASSFPNVAIYVPSDRPFITSDYTGSDVTGFDLISFSFGCSFQQQGPPSGGLFSASGVSKCKVKAYGYRGTTLVAQQVFSYVPRGKVVEDYMTNATLSSDFINVSTVRFRTVYSPAINQSNGATTIDDVVTTLHQPGPE